VPIIPGLGKLRYEDKFLATLAYIARPCLKKEKFEQIKCSYALSIKRTLFHF
jgi:hypothetical protein